MRVNSLYFFEIFSDKYFTLTEICSKIRCTAAAIKYEKHKSYVSRWLKRYDGTLESLKKKSRRPLHHPNEHTAEESKWIADYKRRDPTGSLQDVWCSLRRNKGYKRTMPALYRVMRKLGYFKGKIKKKPPKSGRMQQMTYPGEKIQIDVKYVPTNCISMEYEQSLYQFTAIDEYSRIRYIEGFADNSSYSAMKFLIHTLDYFEKKCGFKVEKVQTDNGREFTNRFDEHPKPTLFEKTLEKLEISHKLIRPYTPRHNGKVERSHREDQARFYDTHKFFSLEDLNNQLKTHLRYTNNRPMHPLKYLSPIEYLQAYYAERGEK